MAAANMAEKITGLGLLAARVVVKHERPRSKAVIGTDVPRECAPFLETARDEKEQKEKAQKKLLPTLFF